MSLNLDHEAWDVNLNAWAPITHLLQFLVYPLNLEQEDIEGRLFIHLMQNQHCVELNSTWLLFLKIFVQQQHT